MKNIQKLCKEKQGLGKYYLSGLYSLSGSYLKPTETRDFKALLISNRKKVTSKKTPKFLLLIHSDGSRDYVSSLYPIKSGLYRIEYRKIDYEVRINGSDCRISVLEVDHA